MFYVVSNKKGKHNLKFYFMDLCSIATQLDCLISCSGSIASSKAVSTNPLQLNITCK